MEEWKVRDKCELYGVAWEICGIWGGVVFLAPYGRDGEPTTATLNMLKPLPTPPVVEPEPWRPEVGKPCLTEGGDGATVIGPDPQLPNNYVCQVTFSDGSRDFESIHVSSLRPLPPAPPVKPCPHCGMEAALHHDGSGYYYRCPGDCDCAADTADVALERWNQREAK